VIEITRLLARSLRAVFRRASRVGSRSLPVVFSAGPAGLTIHSELGEVIVAYRQAGEFAPENITLPTDVLADIEGKEASPVVLERTAAGQCLVRWQDKEVPRVQEFTTLGETTWPELPAQFSSPGDGFLTALDEAMQTANPEATRLGLNRVQLRAAGSMVGTDGKQLLLQHGFHFPWSEDRLVARTTVFGRCELQRQENIAIGQTDSHVVVRAGPWDVFLTIDKEARYPKAEDAIPRLAASAGTHWQLSAEDAAFLLRSLPGLPGDEEDYSPVTIDLGQFIVVRARAVGQERGTVLQLAGATMTGSPLRFCLARQYLLRALRLGLTQFSMKNADSAVLAHSERLQFLCMPLSKDQALAASEHDLCVSSTSHGTDHEQTRKRRKTIMPPPRKNGHDSPVPAAAVSASAAPAAPVTEPSSLALASRSNGERTESSAGDLIGEVQALQGVLRDALTRTAHLLHGLKKQRKQSRLMRTTLASLRQLQLQQVAD
jgi:hypothetical protein